MNRSLLVMVVLAALSQISFAQSDISATSPEKTVGSVEATREIRAAKSYKPPSTNKLPPPGRKINKKAALIKSKNQQ